MTFTLILIQRFTCYTTTKIEKEVEPTTKERGELEVHETFKKPSQFEKLFISWLHSVFTAACGLSLAVASSGYSLVVVRPLCRAVASLVAARRL